MSVDFDPVGLRKLFLLLGESERQNTVFVLCGDRRSVNLGNVETAGDGAIVTFASDIALFFVFLVCFVVLFRGYRKDIVIHFDVDLVSVVARKLGFDDVAVARVSDVGLDR